MSITFKPQYVPSDVISRWPAMALALWRRSFRQQAGILMIAALAMKFMPAWSSVIGFLIAPSLFFISFAAVKIVEEETKFSWSTLVERALPGALRLGCISVKFAACFGMVVAVLFLLAAPFLPVASTPAGAPESFEKTINMQAVPVDAAVAPAQNPMLEVLHFCATCTEGIMAMMFLGLFIVAIYQGVFGAILHAQDGVDAEASRTYGWQAWQINSDSMAQAVRNAPPGFFVYPGIVMLAVIGGFHTVYLSPASLVLATYIPCLAYVAYRSIFLGEHQNGAALNRTTAGSPSGFAPVMQPL